jgi:molybdate transport system ATP-binding protein
MMLEIPKTRSVRPVLSAMMSARVLTHDLDLALTTLLFADGELRVPIIDSPLDSAVRVRIDAQDVSIALSRPMDVSITNRLPGRIAELEPLTAPYVRATCDLGRTQIHALIMGESVDRLALVPGLKVWVMIKAAAIAGPDLKPDLAPRPRPWPLHRKSSQGTS